jgi:cytochrome c biogenesis protein ResB
MDEANIAATVVEVLTDEGSLGTWVLSNWLTEEKPFQAIQLGLRKQLGEKMAADLCNTLAEPQEFTFRGHTYQLALRPVRFYQPFSIQLQRFSHDRYRGTDIPKNFSSRVRVTRPATGEDREVLIYMNSPLRYDGETFYQAGFDDVDPGVTILQVVHNPSWLTPYLSCILVALGLVVQFGTHLAGFIAKRRTA